MAEGLPSQSPICVQPDHFYPNQPNDTIGLLDPDQDPLATRGIPVFKPTMEEFQDFEQYMERVEVWGRKSGIVKIIPPAEWSQALPSTLPLLPHVKLRHPIEQRMDGAAGLFRVQNIEKRKVMTVRDWAELCAKDGLKTPSPNHTSRTARASKRDQSLGDNHSEGTPVDDSAKSVLDTQSMSPQDANFYSSFEPHSTWLPPGTKAEDYTPEGCRNLERMFWRTCGIGTPALYGADMQGSLFTDDTTTFNVAHLPSFLTRLNFRKSLPGVNSPYLYFGMWRATFAWHVEDMDLYSINYIHWGAPKFWYAVPNGRSKALEAVMRGYFPSDTSECPEFLRHKAYLASPTLLAQSSCRPNILVQQQGEFVITYPRGYHAGFNLGLNCAESVNFALESWVDIGRKAGVCQCVPDSVRIDIDALLAESAEIDLEEPEAQKPKRPPASEHAVNGELAAARKRKRPKEAGPHQDSSTITIKIPKRDISDVLQCCLCASTNPSLDATLLPCLNAPPSYTGMKPTRDAFHRPIGDELPQLRWMAHELCARVIPETWVDMHEGVKTVFGIDCVLRDRWNLKCASCVKSNNKKHGAKVQCTRGKCPKAFHVTCAIEQPEVLFKELEEVEKRIILVGGSMDPPPIDINGPSDHYSQSRPEEVKTIKKLTVDVLCSQHNPEVQETRRAHKLEKIRSDLLAMEPMSRIRVRVSSGVFEVTLLSVSEAAGTIDVLWGDGQKRELRWGSIVWGTAPSGTLAPVPIQAPISQSRPTPMPKGAVGTLAVSQAASSSSHYRNGGSYDPSGSGTHRPYYASVPSYAARASEEHVPYYRTSKPPPLSNYPARPSAPVPPVQNGWPAQAAPPNTRPQSYSHYSAYSYPQSQGQQGHDYSRSAYNHSTMPSELYWQQQEEQDETNSGYYRAPIDPTYAASSHPLVRSNYQPLTRPNPNSVSVIPKAYNQFTQRAEDRDRLNSFLNSNPRVREALAAALEPKPGS